MKKISLISLSILLFVMLFSCSKDDDAQLAHQKSNTATEQNASKIKKNPSSADEFKITSLSTEVSSYLDDFYNEDYIEGDDVSISSGGVDYQIVEIVVGDDNRARGYVALNGSGQFMYFFDVDRVGFTATAHDLNVDLITTLDEINEAAAYIETNGFDILDHLEDFEPDDSPGGKFFGWGDEYTQNDFCDNVGMSYKTVCKDFFVFWIIASTSCENQPC